MCKYSVFCPTFVPSRSKWFLIRCLCLIGKLVCFIKEMNTRLSSVFLYQGKEVFIFRFLPRNQFFPQSHPIYLLGVKEVNLSKSIWNCQLSSNRNPFLYQGMKEIYDLLSNLILMLIFIIFPCFSPWLSWIKPMNLFRPSCPWNCHLTGTRNTRLSSVFLYQGKRNLWLFLRSKKLLKLQL